MPLTQAQIEQTFGKFTSRDDPDRKGAIIITGDWILHNLAEITPPFTLTSGAGTLMKKIICHVRIADTLEAVLGDLKDAAYTQLINTFDGCWVPRHMSWDPKRPLSHHCWGIAVDVNARLFPYDVRRQQDLRLISAFCRRGFQWGGDWRVPDPMHFEFVDLSALEAAASQPTGGALKIIVNDRLATDRGRIEDGIAVAPVRPIAEALGATVTYHPEQGKVYIYGRKADVGPE